MRKTTKNSPLNPELLGAPGALQGQDEIFESPEQMVRSIDSLVKFLNKYYSKGGSTEDSSTIGFVIERMGVSFSRDVKEIEIETNFARNRVVILVPLIPKERDTEREERRVRILKEFLPTMKEAQIRATVQLYRTLNADARKALIENQDEERNAN